jgi:uncharacterized heparinase superfamily protein
MPNPSLYFHTIRHLRPQQISSRLLRMISSRTSALSEPHSISLRALDVPARWLKKPVQEKGGFTFLNLRKDARGGRIDWRCADMPKLWRYNLHYFDYLLDGRPPEDGCRLIDDWIANNPLDAPDAWEPFPVSLRVVNWVKFLLGAGNGQATTARLKSICRQAVQIERHVEYHLLANHLFKNGKALFFAGIFFEGRDAERWLRKGMGILAAELREQVLTDGGHFERSPMYHSMILEDCLDLLNLCRDQNLPVARALADRLIPICRRMMAFLLGMRHPDGQIALFNDAAFGIEAVPGKLVEYYERTLGETPAAPDGKLWQFEYTGYFVMAPQPGDRLIVDCGAVGPDYQPGHSHCDTLSFELSLKGRRVVVDSGCCRYEDGDIRRYNRGNNGHNTVTVDKENQSEVWGAHRCARRAYPLYARLQERDGGSILFEGAHDGYKRLKGRPIHHRRITWSGDQIDIQDRIDGRGYHEIESRLHIHPELKVKASDNVVRIIDSARPLMSVSAEGSGKLAIESGWYCPEFNKKLSCPVITFNARSVSLPVRFGWKLCLRQGS